MRQKLGVPDLVAFSTCIYANLQHSVYRTPSAEVRLLELRSRAVSASLRPSETRMNVATWQHFDPGWFRNRNAARFNELISCAFCEPSALAQSSQSGGVPGRLRVTAHRCGRATSFNREPQACAYVCLRSRGHRNGIDAKRARLRLAVKPP